MFLGLVLICTMAIEDDCFYSPAPYLFEDLPSCEDSTGKAAVGFRTNMGGDYYYTPYCVRIPRGESA